MPTLTNSDTFTIGGAAPVVEELSLLVLPPASSTTGKGRLVHPTLGTLDYDNAPTRWRNIDGDIIAAPTWASTKTLQGAANTLWPGAIRDVDCLEAWDSDAGGIKMRMSMLRGLILFFQNPPDPAVGAVQWYPSYTTDLAYTVALVDLTVGGQGVTLDFVSRQGWARGDVELTLRVLGRV